MIHTNSLVDGFPVILGSLPIQFGMIVTLLVAIRVPKDEDGGYNVNCLSIYKWILWAHIINLICQGINHFLDAKYHLEKKMVTIFALII